MRNITIKKKIQRIRKKLRMKGILPKYGEFLTDEQKIIWDQMNNGDFSYWEEFIKEEHKNKQGVARDFNENNKNTGNRRTYIRNQLRKDGHLPPYGQPLNEQQQEIENQIRAGDFSYFNAHRVQKYYAKKERRCIICNDTDEFNFYPTRKNMCKPCLLLHLKNKYRDGDLDKNIEKNKTWILNNFIHVKVLGAKHRAQRKNFEFELTDEIIEEKIKNQNGRCYITNIELSFNHHDWRTLSLDRLNPDMGYTVENTILVTHFVNISKNKMTHSEFIEQIKQCYLGIMEKTIS